jgi:DNA-binding NarL/FixJ family response regulator
MHTSVHAYSIATKSEGSIEEIAASVESAAHSSPPPPIASVRREPIRILLMVDHEVVCLGIRTALRTEDDFALVGEVVDGASAVKLAMQLTPDIALLDVRIGTVDGLGIAQQLLRSCPQTHVVIFTACSEEDFLFRALRIGVHGYLQQSLPLHQIFSALRAVQRGERVLNDSRAVTQVLGEFSRLTRESERTRSGLNDQELALLHLVSNGSSNKDIAARYFWSEVTVKRRMQEIYRKLEVTDRTQAVAAVMRMGLL